MTSRSSATCGAILLAIGVLLLLATTGLIQVDFWGLLIPVLMIALGAWTLWTVFTKTGDLERTQAVAMLEGATSANVKLRFGAGRLNVGGGASGDELARVDALGAVSHRSSATGQERSAEFWIPADWLGDVLAPWKWANRQPPSWDVHLRQALPIALDVQAGACEMDLDLTSLVVRDVRLVTGASSVMVRTPASAGQTHAWITAGAAEVKVRIPPGVAARIHAQTGLGEIKVDRARFPGGNGLFESNDYVTAANKLDLTVEVGAAAAEIS